MKVYRLLRNNQETGPFTAEELLQKGLKPYDLIWVDGKSAAWRYPSEVDVFKPYIAPVDEQPYDRFYKKNDNVPEEKPAQKPLVKPKFRIRAESHKIELVEPEKTNIAQPGKEQPASPITKPAETTITVSAPVQEAAPAWQDALNDWQTQQPEQKESTPVKQPSTIQFPPSSPDELDENYSERLFRAKQNGNRSRQVLSYAVLAVLAPLLIAGMWFGFKHNDAQEEPVTTAAVTEAKDAENKVSTSESVVKPMVVEEKKEEQHAVVKATPPATGAPVTKVAVAPEKHNAASETLVKKPENKPVSTTLPKETNKAIAATNLSDPHVAKPPVVTPGKKATTAPQQVNAVAPAVVNVPVANKPKADAAIAKANTPVATSAAAYNPPPVVSGKKISSYVDVQQENLPAAPGEKSVRFHVKNLGDAQVDLVVLDLQYFDGRGNLRKGSTMYFKKIPAQNDIAVDAPIVKDADRVSYKVSLLSIEQKGVYIVAE